MAENRPLSSKELLAALEWHRAAGVDMAASDSPIDRVAASAAAAPGPKLPLKPAAEPSVAAATPALNADPGETRALAASAKTLDDLRAIMDAYEGCALKLRATQLVFADGNPEAEIMLVGEGPGAEEDMQGKPFVGRAGQLLDRMLAAIGLDRTQVYIANMVPWRPPGNRNPTPEELALCAPFIQRQIALVAPKLLVTLGNVPTQALFHTNQGITRMRGQWKDLSIAGHAMRAIPTLHPAYLLRQPAAKAQAWADMLSVKRAIAEAGMIRSPTEAGTFS